MKRLIWLYWTPPRWRFAMCLVFALWAGVAGRPGAASETGGRAIRVVPLDKERLTQAGLDPADSAGLFIGVSSFDQNSALPRLRYAADDAVALAHLFVMQLRLIDAAQAKLAISGELNSDPTKRQLGELTNAGVVLLAAERSILLDGAIFLREAPMHTNALIVATIASHGFESKDGKVFFMPRDGRRQLIETTGIPLQDYKDSLRLSKANKKVLIVDACREVPEGETRGALPGMSDTLMSALRKAEGMAVLAACSTGQMSWEAEKFGHGVFTHFLLEAARGQAKPRDDNLLYLGEIFSYVAQKTRDWTTTSSRSAQTPWLEGTDSARNMPMAMISDQPPPPVPTSSQPLPDTVRNYVRYGSRPPALDYSAYTNRFSKVEGKANAVADTCLKVTWYYPVNDLRTYRDANARAVNAGGRLPTQEELLSLITESRESGEWTNLDGDFFPKHARGITTFWTSDGATIGLKRTAVNVEQRIIKQVSADDQCGLLIIIDK